MPGYEGTRYPAPCAGCVFRRDRTDVHTQLQGWAVFRVTPEHVDFGATQSEHLSAGKMEVAVDYRLTPVRFVTFTQLHMDSAEKEAGNFRTKETFGSDFSESRSGSETSDTLETKKTKVNTRRGRPPTCAKIIPGTQPGTSEDDVPPSVRNT